MQWIIVLGIATGMRCMTPIAVLCWFMWFAALPVTGLNFWTANFAAVFVFTVMALGEYWVDTQPKTPSRKDLPLVISRCVMGLLVAALVDSSLGEPLAGGVILVLIGVSIGILGGYRARMYFARLVGSDLPVALTESALAAGMVFGALWHIKEDILLVHGAMLHVVRGLVG